MRRQEFGPGRQLNEAWTGIKSKFRYKRQAHWSIGNFLVALGIETLPGSNCKKNHDDFGVSQKMNLYLIVWSFYPVITGFSLEVASKLTLGTLDIVT